MISVSIDNVHGTIYIYNYIYCYMYNCIYTYIETQIYKIKEGKHAIPHMMMTKGSYAAARRDN